MHQSSSAVSKVIRLNLTEFFSFENGTRIEREHEFRFLFQSTRGEDSAFDIPVTRTVQQLNFIFVLGESVSRKDHAFSDSSQAFISLMMTYFRVAAFGSAGIVTLYFVIFGITLIQFEIVQPIVELTEHICNPQEQSKINRFIEKIKKREYDQQFKRNQQHQQQVKTRQKKMKKQLDVLIK